METDSKSEAIPEDDVSSRLSSAGALEVRTTSPASGSCGGAARLARGVPGSMPTRAFAVSNRARGQPGEGGGGWGEPGTAIEREGLRPERGPFTQLGEVGSAEPA